MRVLLIETDPHLTGSLAATRALGQAKWMVGIGSPTEAGFSVASRWSRRWHHIPSPTADLDAFVAATNRAIRAEGYEIVLAAGDAELVSLSYARDRIEAVVPYGPHENLVRSLDKLDLATSTERAGLAAPRTVEATEENLLSFAEPLVVKSRMHWLPGHDGAPTRLDAGIAASRDEARSLVAEIRRFGGEPLLQEFVDGRLMGVTALTDENASVVAYLEQLAPLTWRPRNGMPTRAHTVPVDAVLRAGVEAMLSDLRWSGLVQLQFMVDPAGTPRLIDFNGRVYASLGLATAAGVNFPDLWARLATGRPVELPGPAAEGVRYHWLEGDLKRALIERRGGLPRDLVGCGRYAVRATHATWRWSDPRPALSPGRFLSAARRVRLLSRSPDVVE